VHVVIVQQVQKGCRGGAEVVQRCCRGGAVQEVQKWYRGSAEVVQSRCSRGVGATERSPDITEDIKE